MFLDRVAALVMRGTDESGLDTMLGQVLQMIAELGGEPLDLQRG